MIQPDLRPLGIGEIRDRAVTLFVRRFAVLVLILALVAIPVAICQYVTQPQTAGMIADVRRALSLPPGRESAAILSQILVKNRVGQSAFALVVGAAVLGALSATACVIAVAQLYSGRMPSVRAVYREALRRWGAQLVVLVIFVALGFAVVVGLVLAIFFIALAIGALATISRPVALIVGIPTGIVAVAVAFAVGALLYLAGEMSLISTALENPNPLRGIEQGLRRTLSPAIFWRSLLVAAIVFVVSTIGQMLLLTVAGLLSLLTQWNAVYPIVAVIGGIALNALVTTFIVIHTFDIRVRREGYDLLLAAQSPARASDAR